jgi:hypothetical protein
LPEADGSCLRHGCDRPAVSEDLLSCLCILLLLHGTAGSCNGAGLSKQRFSG